MAAMETEMDDLWLFKVGAEITCNKAPARVLSIQVDKQGVTYQVGFWLSGKWETAWVPDFEVSGHGKDKTKIGFVTDFDELEHAHD